MTDLRTHMAVAVIDTGESTTIFSAVDCQGLVLVAIEVPATFAGTALTFTGVVDDPAGDYFALYDNAGNEISWTVSTSRIVIPTAGSALITGLTSLKVVSGSAEADETKLKLHFARLNP